MSKALWSFLVIIILVVAAFFIFSRGSSEDITSGDFNLNPTEEEEEEVLFPPATNPPFSLVGESGEPIEEQYPVLTALLNDEQSQAVSLEAVDESESSGTAYLLVVDGSIQHAVIATMPPPVEGNVYEGWIVQPAPLQFFSTGLMTSPELGVWILEYTADEDLPSYRTVVITEETVVDATPERHVIEGSF